LFEVEAYHKLIAVTDVAMNIAPNLQDKISIVNNTSVECLNKLGIDKLKGSSWAVEMVSETMQATLDAALLSKMNQRDQIKHCLIDGPLALTMPSASRVRPTGYPQRCGWRHRPAADA
jgi:phosphate butyryltransferase